MVAIFLVIFVLVASHDCTADGSGQRRESDAGAAATASSEGSQSDERAFAQGSNSCSSSTCSTCGICSGRDDRASCGCGASLAEEGDCRRETCNSSYGSSRDEDHGEQGG